MDVIQQIHQLEPHYKPQYEKWHFFVANVKASICEHETVFIWTWNLNAASLVYSCPVMGVEYKIGHVPRLDIKMDIKEPLVSITYSEVSTWHLS